MKEKKIAIYLIITIIVFSMIIGITIWLVTGNKKVKNNNINKVQNINLENTNVEARTIQHTYENLVYKIDLYSDGTATVTIKSDIQLWGDLETSQDENYKKEKNALNSILTQGRQIDSNNRKIEEVFISNYIGDIYDNYNYGKAIIKCEGNVFYLLDLASDKKVRIIEDWTEKCREVNSDKIIKNLQSECLAEVIEKQSLSTNKIFSGISTDNKYKYTVSFDENGKYGMYINLIDSEELVFYGIGEIEEKNTQIISNMSYYKFSFAKPNGGNISGTMKQINAVQDEGGINSNNEVNESTTKNSEFNNVNIENSMFIEVQDISSQSNANYSTNVYLELKAQI